MELPYHEVIITWRERGPKMFYSWVGIKKPAKWVFFPYEKVFPQKFTSEKTKTEISHQLARKRGIKRVKSLPEPAVGKYLFWLFLGKTVIPKEKNYFNKKSFHWKIIPMENAWPRLQRIGPLASARGRGVPRSADWVCHSPLAQSRANCFHSPRCHFSSSLSAYVDRPLFRAGTASHCMLYTAYCNTRV